MNLIPFEVVSGRTIRKSNAIFVGYDLWNVLAVAVAVGDKFDLEEIKFNHLILIDKNGAQYIRSPFANYPPWAI